MHLLRKNLFTLTTPSLFLHFHPPLLINNNFITNPHFSKPLYMLLFSRSSTINSTPEAKQSVEEHDWNKLMKRFDGSDQLAANLISDFKSQYTCATDKEDYENALRLHQAIKADIQNDALGRVMSKLNKAIEGERLEDATFLQDDTGSGLAMYLMRKIAPKDSQVAEDMKLEVHLSHLTSYPSQVLWDNTKETSKDILAECEINRKFEGDKATKFGKLSAEEKSAIQHAFAVGDIVEKETGKLDKGFLHLPATLERTDCFLYPPSVDGSNDQQRCSHESWPFVLSRTKNQQPLLSGITTFERIEVPASSDPLNGLCIGSKAFPNMEVIQISRRFGHWHEDGGIDNVSSLEPWEYAEVVKLTVDSDVQAGQVPIFEAKVGEICKLPPWSLLEKDFGVVARYKGKGRLTGVQNSGWVDAELLILRKEYRKPGFANGCLYSASDYHYMKCFKQMRECTFCA